MGRDKEGTRGRRRVVHKYPLPSPGKIGSARIPHGPFSVVLVGDVGVLGPQIWLLHASEECPKERDVYFVAVATGDEIGDVVGQHVGSFVQRGAGLVWHVFLLHEPSEIST